MIGEQEGGLYKLKGHIEQALVHDTVEPNELCIEGLKIFITEHYHLEENILKVFHKFKQNMMEYAKDVRKERIQRRHFQVARSRKNESWK